MALLEVSGLRASYSGHEALKGISLTIGSSEIVGVCGPNKAGKSTLCKCLAGTKTASAGEIIFNDRNVTALPARSRPALGISFCPERGNEAGEANPIYLNQTVGFNFEILRNGVPRLEWQERVRQVLSYFPFTAHMKQMANTLSGGEAQMLGIARKLALLIGQRAGHSLLVIDEPARGLAQKAISQLFLALERVREDCGISILLVDEMASRLHGVDRAYFLHDGSITVEGTIKDLMINPTVIDVFN
jgi:branched-chain amino acid transport system ATP-binding protein